MKTAFLCLLLLASAHAQQVDRDALIRRLNADLLPLKSPSDDAERTRITHHFASDLNGLYQSKGIATRILALELTRVLAGKDLSDATLTPLTGAILDIADSAYASRSDASDLVKSPQFRASIEQAFNALVALHIEVPQAQNVMRLLYQAANRIARPPIRPIPPG